MSLYVEVKKPDGRLFRWGVGDLAAGNVPEQLRFSTRRMEGFAEGTVVLNRELAGDYVDIDLYDEVTFVDDQGRIAFEGRINSHPRDLDENGETVQVELVGHMAIARDRGFREIYVDRDLEGWGPHSRTRRALFLNNADFSLMNDPQVVTDPDGEAALIVGMTGPWPQAVVDHWNRSEAIYDGQGIKLGRLYWYRRTINQGATGWDVYAMLVGAENAPDGGSDVDLTAAGNSIPGSGGYVTATGDRYFARVFDQYFTPNGQGDEAKTYEAHFTKLAVYGASGVPLAGDEDPQGVVGSDVIIDIANRFCPGINPAGVGLSGYPIRHLAYTERTDPYDAWLDINRYHLWELALLENKTLYWWPLDATEPDYVVRLDDPGVTVQLQGDDSKELANGIVVEYDDLLTGRHVVLEPDHYPDLQDNDPENPVNSHGLVIWTEITLSEPALQGDALQIGSAALAEFNQPKAPGTITVKGDTIKTRAGGRVPLSQVRSSQTVAIEDHTNDRPRVIGETEFTEGEPDQLAITVDGTKRYLSAYLDRTSTAIKGSGVGSV